MSDTDQYECSACGQRYLGGSNVASGTCELCGEAGTLTLNGEPVPVTKPADPAEESEPSPEEVIEGVCNLAAALMSQGMSASAVKKGLIGRGLDEEAAGILVPKLAQARSRAVRAVGLRNMGIGAAVCVIGAVVTLLSHKAASERGGGTYVIAWGAVVFGAIQFLRGLVQAMTGR